MRYFGFLLLFICVYSCNYFDKKKVSAEDILNKELKTFNWNEVDSYPAFETCDSLVSKDQKKQCFESTLSNNIAIKLDEFPTVVTETLNDTVIVEFLISIDGKLSITNIKASNLIKKELPKLDSLLTASLLNLPKIYPAIKRGQHVKTAFKLPVIVQAD